MGSEDSNSGEGYFLIKTIVSDLIDDVNEFPDVLEHIGFEEGFLVHVKVMIINPSEWLFKNHTIQ